MNTQLNPLVSVVVITFNSANFIEDALESIKNQSYQNLELVISDDCSKDETITICSRWLKMNGNRFTQTKLLTSPLNTGISPNCNRGIKAATGIWIKTLAGDDLLTKDSVQLFINYINENNHRQLAFVFGACQHLIGNQADQTVISVAANFRNGDSKFQYSFLIRRGNCIQGPTHFFNREKLLALGGFDERIKYSEDWPLFINATRHGYKLFFIDDVVAYYRIHENGIFSKTLLKHKYDSRLSHAVNLIRELYLLPLLAKEHLYLDYWHIMLMLHKERNENNWLLHLWYYLLQLTDIRAIKILLGRFKHRFQIQ